MAIEYMLTTVDNPHDPFTNYAAWNAWDVAAGYHTSAFLARIARTSYDISEADQELAIQDAIDEIVELNVLGVYKKASKEF